MAPGETARRTVAILGSASFLVLAPGTVAGLVPFWISAWRFPASTIWSPLFRAVGTTLVCLGALGVLDSFRRFAVEGLGTPAPVFPTRSLVVTGLYRHVRNPMYVSVTSVVLGQALLFESVPLLVYGSLVWLGFHVFVLVYEEPTLRATFGAEYEAFCRGVPRWRPRFTPWKG